MDIENPRAQFERELKRAGQDLVKAEAKEKEYEGFKVVAEEVEKRETEEKTRRPRRFRQRRAKYPFTI